MKIIRNIGIALLCCVILVSGQNISNDDDDPTTTPATTTISPSTSTSTTTTEPPPETTTATPTTTPTTTESPSTTTVRPAPAPVPPTPTPSGPDYPRNNGKWSVEDATNSTCIALKGAMQIVVLNNENKTVSVNIPALATSTGTCEEPQTLTLTWDSEVATKLNILTLSFEMNNATKGALTESSGITSGKFGLQNVTIELHLSQNVTNSTSTEEKIHKSLVNIGKFQTPLKHSYSCLAEEVVKSQTGDFSLKIREVQLEAYRVTAPGHREFSTAVQCPADDATDVVPIAVGAALAGLVVIVLIAYLIGRRRSRARGYQSV